jgi:hypothetical protein
MLDGPAGEMLGVTALLGEPLLALAGRLFSEGDHLSRTKVCAIDKHALLESSVAAGARELVPLRDEFLLRPPVAVRRLVDAARRLLPLLLHPLARTLSPTGLALSASHGFTTDGRSPAFRWPHFSSLLSLQGE